MKKALFILIVLVISAFILVKPCYSKHVHLEKEYQEGWCKARNGIIEYELPDKTRVDCLTDKYAVEFDFSYKVYESIGQSLYYSIRTGKPPAVVLIMENPDRSREQKYLDRLNIVAKKYGITVFIMTPEDIEKQKDTSINK